MAGKSLGILSIDLIAKTGKFAQGLDKAGRDSTRWKTQREKEFNQLAKTAKITAAAIGTAFAGSVIAMTKSGMEAVDNQNQLAKSLNTTYDSITQLRKAFSDAGVDGFESSMSRLNRRLGAAELGRGAALKAVQELGLNLKELASTDAANRVAIIADRIKAVSQNSQQAARYAQDLGFEQAQAAAFFIKGGDAIRNSAEYVERMGLAMSDLDAAKVEAAAGSFAGLKDSTKALSQNFAVSFAPAIEAINNLLIDAAQETGSLQDRTDYFVESAVKGFAFAVNAVDGFGRTVEIAGKGIAMFALAMEREMMAAAGAVVDFPIKALNELIDLLNSVPGVDIGAISSFELADNLRVSADAADAAVKLAMQDIDALLQAELAGEKLLREYEKAKADITARAEKELESRAAASYGYQAAAEAETEAVKEVGKSYLELLARYDSAAAAGLRYKEEIEAINESTADYEARLHLITLAQQRFNETINEPAELGYWEKWLEGAEQALSSFDQMAADVLQNFSSGVGNAFESMAFDAESFEGAMHKLAEGMARSIINALGQMAGQWLAYQAVQMLVGKTTQTAAAQALIFNAQAGVFQAGINAYASTAAIPIVGPLAAPAAMTTAISTTQPMAAAVQTMALSGMAHDGIDKVPETGTWLLEKGERVTTAETSAKLDSVLDDVSTNGGRGDVIVNLIEDAGRAGEVDEDEDDERRKIINIFVADIMGDGQSAAAVQNKWGLTPAGR